MIDSKYIFLTPVRNSPRAPNKLIKREYVNTEIVVELFSPLQGEVHLDLETTGVDWWHAPSNGEDITTIGIAWSGGVFAIDTRNFTKDNWKYVINKLSECSIIAYNTVFDMGWLYSKIRELRLPSSQFLAAISGCSMTLYRGLANEGYTGQRYDLGTVQSDFLGWQEVNKNWLKDMLQKYQLKKSEMWKLVDKESRDYLYYCAIDAEASKQAHEELSKQAIEKDCESKLSFYKSEELLQIKELIFQQWHGMKVNRTALMIHAADLFRRRQEAIDSFKNHPDVAPYIAEWENENCLPKTKVVSTTRKIKANKKDEPWLHTEVWTKDEERTSLKKWEKMYGAWYMEVTTVKEKTIAPKYKEFNISSNKQLTWLFYEKLYKYEIIEGAYNNSVNLHLGNRTVNLNLTKAGGLPCGKDVYPALGEPGKALALYNNIDKELGYVKKAISISARDGRIHAGFITYGTKTGRLAAVGGFNLAQQKKTEPYLSCFIPDDGYVFVDIDISALEPTVQAEFSNDATLIDLYASGKTHDIYLWWARFIHPDETLRKQLKEEYKPNVETIEELKKKYKKQRTFIKKPILGFNYGLGPKKLHRDLTVEGYDLTLEECKLTFDLYWSKLEGVKKWEQKLLKEWEGNGGWIRNAFGHPISLPANYKKDIVNKFTQNTGHCVLQKMNKHIVRLLVKEDVEEVPIIQDFHDERISMCKVEDAERLKDIFNRGITLLNKELQSNIPMTGEAEIGTSIWDFKK